MTTAPEHDLTTMNEEPQAPLKYGHPQFAGYAGERLLHEILRKILPSALFQTWRVLTDHQALGNDCYLSVEHLSERANRGTRAIRNHLAELQARRLLVLRSDYKVLPRRDGSHTLRMVVVKDFSGLYDLALAYLHWTQSDGYIAPERIFATVILADEALTRSLLRFNNYRRILCTQAPGPKPRPRPCQQWYLTTDEEPRSFIEQEASSPQISPVLPAEDAVSMDTGENRNGYLNRYLNRYLKTYSYRIEESKIYGDTQNEDSNSSGSARLLEEEEEPHAPPVDVAAHAIGNPKETHPLTPEPARRSNRPIPSEQLAARAKQASAVLQEETASVVVQQAMSNAATTKDEPVPPLPIYVEGTCLVPLSDEFRDQKPRSSATRLSKLYWRMHAYGFDEFAFARLLDHPAAKTLQQCHARPITRPMAYFFRTLENDLNALCRACDEELHARALASYQPATPPAPPVSSPSPSSAALPVPAMESEEEAIALLERIEQEIGEIADLSLCDGWVRATDAGYVVDLDLSCTLETGKGYRSLYPFATAAQWDAYYADLTRPTSTYRLPRAAKRKR